MVVNMIRWVGGVIPVTHVNELGYVKIQVAERAPLYTMVDITINDIAKSLNRNEQTDVIFLDFPKAFD